VFAEFYKLIYKNCKNYNLWIFLKDLFDPFIKYYHKYQGFFKKTLDKWIKLYLIK